MQSQFGGEPRFLAPFGRRRLADQGRDRFQPGVIGPLRRIAETPDQRAQSHAVGGIAVQAAIAFDHGEAQIAQADGVGFQ